MSIKHLISKEFSIVITWNNGEQNEYPYIWLRDNDPDELHPDTLERTFDLTSVCIDISPKQQSYTEQSVVIRWPDRNQGSIYTCEWLMAHKLGQQREDAAAIKRVSWNAAQMSELPRFKASACKSTSAVLLDVLNRMQNTGIVIIEGLDDDPSAGEQFADLIGFKRETNFGVMFEVQSKPNPNNLAYTSHLLPLHTDLANQELVPGFQFLHCYRNEAIGGGSVFSDGLSCCENLAKEDPHLYHTLINTSVPWRFHDAECDLRQRRPVISLDENNNFKSITLNPHLADIPDLNANQMRGFYRAYQALMNCTRSPEQRIEYVLKKGEMVIFDNLRVLHGRNAFDPNSGSRHLRGFYIEYNEVKSKIRMLSVAI